MRVSFNRRLVIAAATGQPVCDFEGRRGTPFTKRSLKREMAGRAPGHLMHGFRSGEGRQPILISLPSLTDWTAASASANAARPSAPDGEIFEPFSIAAMKLAISLA